MILFRGPDWAIPIGLLAMTPLALIRIEYSSLSAKQQENYNYQKLAGVLADFGFITHRLSADWNGADFIAQHLDGLQFLKVQLKGRLSFCRKYLEQNIWIAFPVSDGWYLYPHDKVFEIVSRQRTIQKTDSWITKGEYNFPSLSVAITEIMAPYRIPT